MTDSNLLLTDETESSNIVNKIERCANDYLSHHIFGIKIVKR